MKDSTEILAARICKPKEDYHSNKNSYYFIYLPGVGRIGNYPRLEDAQATLCYVPLNIRKQAVIFQASHGEAAK